MQDGSALVARASTLLIEHPPKWRSLVHFNSSASDLPNTADKQRSSEVDQASSASSPLFDGVAAYKDFGADILVAVGGGAPLDTAKLIALKTTHERPLVDYDDATGGDQFITSNVPPLVAIPKPQVHPANRQETCASRVSVSWSARLTA